MRRLLACGNIYRLFLLGTGLAGVAIPTHPSDAGFSPPLIWQIRRDTLPLALHGSWGRSTIVADQHTGLLGSLVKSLSRNPGLRRIFQGGKANISCDTMFLTGYNRPKAQQDIRGLGNIADMDRSSHPIGEADRHRRMNPYAIHNHVQRGGSAVGC